MQSPSMHRSTSDAQFFAVEGIASLGMAGPYRLPSGAFFTPLAIHLAPDVCDLVTATDPHLAVGEGNRGLAEGTNRISGRIALVRWVRSGHAVYISSVSGLVDAPWARTPGGRTDRA
jgi:hypothetical protein